MTGHVRHGHASAAKQSPEYKLWVNIQQRCHNPNDKSYQFYGGRGIAVCPEWRASFEAFLAHVGLRPTAQHTLDRIDNDRGYEPGNVRWLTRYYQIRNTRKNRHFSLNGRTQCLRDWATELGFAITTLRYRLKTMTFEEAVTRPMRAPRRQRPPTTIKQGGEGTGGQLCGYLIRDGQTTIGACEREAGHAGECQRGWLKSGEGKGG